MKKKLATIFVVTVLAILLVACSTPTTDETTSSAANSSASQVPAKSDDGVKSVGFSMAEITGQAVQVEAKAFEETAKSLGFTDVQILSAENKVETQISQIRDLITRGCDAICIYSADPDGVVPAVQACNAANIPVIAVDRGINGGNVYYYIASNNIGDGRDAATYFGYKTAGQPNDSVEILHIFGNLSSTAQKERADGFKLGCENWPQLKIVKEVATNADADKIYNAVVDAFKTNPNIKGIFVPYDQLLSPVVSALKAINKFYPLGDPNHVMLGAVDGATEQLEWLSEGINDISISLDFQGFGSEAAIAAANYVDGKIATTNKYLTKSIICTKDNVDALAAKGMLWGKSK